MPIMEANKDTDINLLERNIREKEEVQDENNTDSGKSAAACCCGLGFFSFFFCEILTPLQT